MLKQALAVTYHVYIAVQLLVVFDDIDSDFGVVKVKQKGGHGGHNGMRDIIAKFGGQSEFPRIKIGIGRPTGQMPVAAYVLGKWHKDELDEKDNAVREAVDAMTAVCELGVGLALSGKR
jgi:peptidyl-tRNA hydrolase, PTH1 family